jgi:hypothetical protein
MPCDHLRRISGSNSSHLLHAFWCQRPSIETPPPLREFKFVWNHTFDNVWSHTLWLCEITQNSMCDFTHLLCDITQSYHVWFHTLIVWHHTKSNVWFHASSVWYHTVIYIVWFHTYLCDLTHSSLCNFTQILCDLTHNRKCDFTHQNRRNMRSDLVAEILQCNTETNCWESKLFVTHSGTRIDISSAAKGRESTVL